MKGYVIYCEDDQKNKLFLCGFQSPYKIIIAKEELPFGVSRFTFAEANKIILELTSTFAQSFYKQKDFSFFLKGEKKRRRKKKFK